MFDFDELPVASTTRIAAQSQCQETAQTYPIAEAWQHSKYAMATSLPATQQVGLAATSNDLAQDRADFSYASEEMCRELSVPNIESFKKLKVAALSRNTTTVNIQIWVANHGH